MNIIKAAYKVSKIEDQHDSLRLRTHAVTSMLNLNEQEGIRLKYLTVANFPDYVKEKSLSVLLYLVSIPALMVSWFKPKSFLGGVFLLTFLLISIGLLLVGVVSGSMYYYLSLPVDEQQLQHYLTQHRQHIAIRVYDEQNQLLGALPPLSSEYNDQVGALYVKSVPSLYWQLIKSPSDKNLSFTQQPSFWSLYKKIIQFSDAYYKGVNLSAPYQAKKQYETLMTRIAKDLQSNTKNNQGLSEYFFGNNGTLQIARNLYPYLAQNKGEEFKRWTAMHAPLFSAKNDVYGLSAIALSLFGKTPEQLNAGQQALLATSYHQQTKMALLFSTKADVRQNTWRRLIKNTRLMATRYLKQTQPQTLRRILTDLEAMQVAPPLTISSQWLTFIKKQPDNALPLYQHLLQRSELTLGKTKINLYQNLQQELKGLDKGTVVTDVKISLPFFKNQQLSQLLAAKFKTIHRFYPNSFKLRLGKSVKDNGASISIKVASEEGKIIRFYQRGSAVKRPIAGLGSLAVSSLLLSLNDTPKTRYCNKSYAGIRNATEPLRDGITSCKKLNNKGHSFSLQQSIQQEKTLSLLYALKQTHKIPLNNFIKLYKDFSLSINSSENTSLNRSELAYELTLGKVKARPEDMHTIIHALTRNLYDIPYDSNPSITDSIEINYPIIKNGKRSIKHVTRQGGKRSPVSIDNYFVNQIQQNYMKLLFSIPSAKKNNPLKFLDSVEKKYGVDFLLVKSATSKTNTGNTKDKWLVGSVRLKQNIYSFTIMIGSDNGTTGLGKNINHRQLMLPVINAIIESLQQ
jgi:hypothetical protein